MATTPPEDCREHFSYAHRDARFATLRAACLIPVLCYDNAATAAYAAEVAVSAGCSTLELIWTIPGVTDLVRALRDKHGPALSLDMGTVLTENQAREALEAGADFWSRRA